MIKYLNKAVAFLLVLILIISNCIIASAETSYTKGYITIYNVSNNERISYEAIDVNGELFVSSDDIAKIINMKATTCEDSVFYSNYYANRSIDVCFDGNIWTRGITYKATVHNVDETYYFPLEKMLYLANAQWCVENNIVYVQLTDNTILDFIDAYCMEILDNNITQTELLMNGESELSNAAKSSFAAIFNDFDVRVFVPIWGAITLTVEDYQNAMLQLAKDELEFVDEYGQKNLNDLLDKSSFSEIKSIWDDAQSVADLPENILTATDYVNQTYLWIKDTKKGTKMFSEYNNLADFTPAEISAISKELQGVSDVLTIANAIVNVNEIATRSKSWNEDFLAQIELLTDFDETGYNKSMVNYIKKASTSLLKEHADTFSATTDACVEETLKVLGEKLVDLTPAGTITSIITTGLSVAKLLDEDFATSFDALELSNMVEWLIRIEYVAFTEMSRDIVTMRMKSLNGGSTLEELTELRNTTMLALRTNLRNKVFIYYLNTVRNNNTSWVNSDEAKEIEQDILWNYAKIIELSESEPFDRLLVLDSFENMYSNEYGCKRDKINADVLSETNTVSSSEEAYRDILTMYHTSISHNWSNCDGEGWNEVGDPDNACYIFWHYEKDRSLKEVGYTLIDINNDGQSELFVSLLDIAGTGSFYDMYTIVNGEVVHVVSAGERDRYNLAENYSINNNGSSGAANSSNVNYRLDAIDGALKVNQAVIYDGWRDSENPYFYATTEYYDEETYETNYDVLKPISNEEASVLLDKFPKNTVLKLTPFDKYDPSANTDNVTAVTEEALFDEYIQNNIVFSNGKPYEKEGAGLFSRLIQDYDGDNTKEMVTFSIGLNPVDQPYIEVGFYVIDNGVVVKKSTEERFLVDAIGMSNWMVCATYEDGIIRVSRSGYNMGGSIICQDYESYCVKNKTLVRNNCFSDYFNRGNVTRVEAVSGKTYSSANDWYSAVQSAGFSLDAHYHINSETPDFDPNTDDYNTALCFKGNHIFTLFNSQNDVVNGIYGFIYDNTGTLN